MCKGALLRQGEIFEYFVTGLTREYKEKIIGAGKRNIKDTIQFIKNEKLTKKFKF